MLTDIRTPNLEKFAMRPSVGRWFEQLRDAVSIGEPLVETETEAGTIEV
jgi:hypothetical protein